MSSKCQFNAFGRRVFLVKSGNLMAFVGLSLLACDSTDNPSLLSQEEMTTMKLESNAFSAGETIPAQYTCDGKDVSPALRWEDIPSGTQSFALIVDDPDAPNLTFIHWVVYDIPAEVRHLPAAIPVANNIRGGGVQGKNDFGKLGYGGPCPPSGIHRYFFKLYALDRILGLGAGATKAQLEAAMSGHILGAAELIGRYSRQR